MYSRLLQSLLVCACVVSLRPAGASEVGPARQTATEINGRDGST
jgi:hypothetical protein